MMNMKEKIKYFSTDKMYRMNHFNNRRFNLKTIAYALFVLVAFVLVLGGLLIKESLKNEEDTNGTKYAETGSMDYTVYYKNNMFYDTKYLHSGMKYVASLINTINPKFNYEIHVDKNIEFKYKYNIEASLKIMDPTNHSKILYVKDEVLLEEVSKEDTTNNIVVNEDLIIDYSKYNNIVNSYKREYGLSVDSELILTMSIVVDGISDVTSDKIDKISKLQMSIPLSEQTIDISINTQPINNSGYLSSNDGLVINNYLLYALGIMLIIVGAIISFVAIKLFREYNNFNIYDNTVNKILKEYDRLIVTGKMTLDESKFSNIVIPETFEEMVDASQNLKTPILFYEVIKGEKCFFVIIKDETLYKYRLTRAYLERKEHIKDDI